MLADWAGSILALIPDLVPWLFVAWMFAGVISVIDLARAERGGRLPPRPIGATVRQWLGWSLQLTAVVIALTAYDHRLISLAALVVVLAAGVVIGHVIAGRPMARWGRGATGSDSP